ncbi:alcohol dehydrogenase [Moesziomyces antarcticus]|uniref:Related to Alcohol dehydrogenase class III chi chain n=2 Tax=Pseudozyma antarctica TaxID=84753 RepID=A0A5C3FU01_PSEA2|nr:alcohol dehydrogenase [Moesziomyces antarcticus]GAK66601.1 alcohol dehydrogenase [Moesziomyces antarcticus]SPO47650.1 related to Alcohol dehydrogenase class III chi chain [Moesziomyces antarcticus]
MAQTLQAQALVIEQAHGPFQLADIQLDISQLKSDEVVVRYHHTGVCHTDIHCRNVATPQLLPAIYGHEGAGTVEQVSSDYKGSLKVGDSVLASFCSCGGCNNCNSSRPAYCDLFVPINLAHFTKEMQHVKVPYQKQDGEKGEALIKYFGQSSFSSRMIVTDRSLTKVSSNVPTKLVCALACGFQTGFATVFEKAPTDQPRSFELFESAGVPVPSSIKTSSRYERSKQTLIVTGLGGVGLGAIYGGKTLGFGSVIACDLNDDRLELAKEVGATHTINVRGLDSAAFAAKVKEYSADGRGASLAIEASGAPAAMGNAVMALAVGGRSVVVGAPPSDAPLPVPHAHLLAQATSVEGLLMGNSVPEVTIPYLVGKLEAGELPFLDKMVKVYKPADMNTAVEDQESGKVIKPVIAWE